ncbi:MULTISPECIES: protealysin inhibitor emfourin [Microbacterium]|uniref:Uncharacterized protein n=1 Tax=Microbacterium trichothecenolyticum TaxID=69370 RepID=A0A0M2HH72_MICTR|nr:MULTISPECIES: protealysin inhibitor emfourin [Microbacterium]KJL44105.1 hypothetical protein RS82_01067 [Microbacterium trichothecenolyticum]MDR7189191.1 hypothetical protein [Microbacterium sp. BE35]
MTETPSPDPTAPPARPPAVEVDVARTGGIAGMTRRWSAQPPEAEASEWITLIDRCPWSEASAAAGEDPDDEVEAAAQHRATRRREPMPDGFVWSIRATWSGTGPLEAELPDDEVVGAWRELVDAVRDWSRQSVDPGRSSG